LKSLGLDHVNKKILALQEEMKKKADKTQIFSLEQEKAEKLFVDGEF
jgi:hypothetical protein